MKQETLEEAVAKKLYPFNDGFQVMDIDISEELQVAFANGAKWQQEQYTIEEQCVGHTIDELDKEYIKGFNEGSAYQQERMYSEEDMKNAFDSAREFNSLDGVVDVHIVLPMGGDMSDLQPLHFTFDEWFNEFKKK
jgi:hypothetical protein